MITLEDIGMIYELEWLAGTAGPFNTRESVENYLEIMQIIHEGYGACWEEISNEGHYKLEKLGPYYREVKWDLPESNIYGIK